MSKSNDEILTAYMNRLIEIQKALDALGQVTHEALSQMASYRLHLEAGRMGRLARGEEP